MTRKESGLHVFILIVTALGVGWSLVIHDLGEVRNCIFVWGIAHVITRILGFLGQFDAKPSDAEAGVNRRGPGQ